MQISRVRPGLLVALAVLVLFGAPAARAGSDLPRVDHQTVAPLWDGVEWTATDATYGPSGRNAETGPVRYHVLRVAPGADVRLKPVVAQDRVGSGLETVSSMCARAGAIACVNANFPECPKCAIPFGGLVRKHQLLQSPTAQQNQITYRGGRLSSIGWALGARLTGASIASPVLDLDGINTGPADGAVVLHTHHFGPSTGAPAGSYEVVVSLSSALWATDSDQWIQFRRVETAGDTAIPKGSAVISGVGRGAFELWQWTEANLLDPMLLTIRAEEQEMVLSGHPVLLRHGERVNLDPSDGKVVRRHPRTAIGWNPAGSVFIVVVDGRQPHSMGMDLAELSELFLRLGATDAVNLDGGGSSAMARWCGLPEWCVVNAPSDGGERRVPIGLAIVPPERW